MVLGLLLMLALVLPLPLAIASALHGESGLAVVLGVTGVFGLLAFGALIYDANHCLTILGGPEPSGCDAIHKDTSIVFGVWGATLLVSLIAAGRVFWRRTH